jgi:hypothetical protein
VRLVVTADRPCCMQRGTLRRVPQNPTQRVIGYSVCCPRCAFVTFALQGFEGQKITEIDSDIGTRVSFAQPLHCLYCGVRVHVIHNEATLEEPPGVQAGR